MGMLFVYVSAARDLAIVTRLFSKKEKGSHRLPAIVVLWHRDLHAAPVTPKGPVQKLLMML
jgi:hypothetical protein